MTKTLIAAAALLAGSAAIAQTAPVAQPSPAPQAAPPAAAARPMRDRVMTRDETVAKVRQHFGRMDADKDGAITTAEIDQLHTKFTDKAHAEGAAPHVMMMREHGDPNAAFDRLDANKDGSISREEFAKAREERFERRIVMRDELKDGATPKDGKDVRRHVMRMHGAGGFGGRMIVMADTDKDGRITLAEAEALALQHFDQMDANKDGQVTREERRSGRPLIIKRTTEQDKNGS